MPTIDNLPGGQISQAAALDRLALDDVSANDTGYLTIEDLFGQIPDDVDVGVDLPLGRHELRRRLTAPTSDTDAYYLIARKATTGVRVNGYLIGYRNAGAGRASTARVHVVYDSDSGGDLAGAVWYYAQSESGGSTRLQARLVELSADPDNDGTLDTYVAVELKQSGTSFLAMDEQVEFVGHLANADMTLQTASQVSSIAPFTGVSGQTVFPDGNVGIGTQSPPERLSVNGPIAFKDGVTAPTAVPGWAIMYVDIADGDLKVVYGNGTRKTLAADT